MSIPEQLELQLVHSPQSSFEDIPLSKLILSEKNPRTITKDQMVKLVASLKSDPHYLEARPVCVNMDTKSKTYNVYAGHQRVRAAKKLGWKKIRCHISYDLSMDLMYERMLKDNKTVGEFDFDMLANLWDIDVLLACGFDFEDLHDEKPEKKSKKEKDTTFTCPNCQHTITL